MRCVANERRNRLIPAEPRNPQDHEAFKESFRLRAESQELKRQLRDMESGAFAERDARRAALNLLEDAVAARDAAQREAAERMRAERELEIVVTQTPFLLTRCSRDLRYVFVSRPYAQMLGREREEIIDRPIVEIMGEQGFEEIRPYVERVLRGERVEYEREIHFQNIGPRTLRVVYSPDRDEEENVMGWVASILDITEHKRAELALRESQERLRLIVENAQDFAIISMDPARRVTSWNPGAERLLGYMESEILGQSADIIFTPEDRATGACESEMQTALATGRASDARWHVRKNGSRFWGSGVMTKLHDASGDVVGLAKIFRDHTAIREAQQAIEKSLSQAERAQAEAEAAVRAKDHFLAVLSHELRTPLTPVLMAVDVLGRSDKLDEGARKALDMIRRNIELEADLIKDLLDVTRIGRGKFEITCAPVDFHETIRCAIGVSQSEIEKKQQRLTVALEAGKQCVKGDFGRLQQVVWNLLKNASKFTSEGGEIRVHTRNTDRRVVLEVTDTGIGIAQEALVRIFEPFTQANPELADQFGGLGLGLTIARAIIDAHSGELYAQSDGKDRGSTFAVVLPLSTKS